MVVGRAGRQRTTRRTRLAGAAASLALTLVVTACGNDADNHDPLDDIRTSDEAGSTSSTASGPGLPACDSVDHTVIFSILGTVTVGGDDELGRWVDDGEEPEARPGAAEVVRAYRDLGYEVLYVTSEAETVQVHGQSLVEAVMTWLGVNGFPIDDGTDIWAGSEDRDVSIALIEHLALMSNTGVEIRAAYASDPDVVFPLATSGISSDNVFAVGDAASDATVTSLPAASMHDHLPDVESLDPVCE